MFENTPLHQDTYEMKRCLERHQWDGAYSPWCISTWEYSERNDSGFDAENMFLHEIAHCLEMAERRGMKRLLLKNYGYEFGSFNPTYYGTEMRVLGLQDALGFWVFGRGVSMEMRQATHTSFSKVLGVTFEEFEERFEQERQAARAKGAQHYFDLWQRVCQYVKDNRGEKELSMMDLFGFNFG